MLLHEFPILLVKNRLRCKFHCHKGLNTIRFSYKIDLEEVGRVITEGEGGIEDAPVHLWRPLGQAVPSDTLSACRQILHFGKSRALWSMGSTV